MGSEAAVPRSLLIVRPSLASGGADHVTLTLLRELDRSHFRPTLALLRREGVLLPRVPGDVPVRSLGARSLWTAWWPLARLLRRERPDILLSTSSGANVVAALASWLTPGRRRLVLSERSVLARRARGKSMVIILLKRWLYPGADSITAVSEGVRSDLLRRLRLPEERVRVVFSPVITPETASLAAAAPSHRWLSEPEPVILAAGRLVPAKGFDCLIDAFARLGDRPGRLLILGEGVERRRLEAQVDRLGLRERVALPGFDPNPFASMSRCALFVLSSRREGLPGALIQAMACGAPVVATDCQAGPAEIIRHGVSGLLVPVDEPRLLAGAIAKLLDDAPARAAMAARGRERAQLFTAQAVIPRYIDALLGRETDTADPRERGCEKPVTPG